MSENRMHEAHGVWGKWDRIRHMRAHGAMGFENSKMPALARVHNCLTPMSYHLMHPCTHVQPPHAPMQVTLTDGASGETVRQFAIKDDPHEMCVATRKDGVHKAGVRAWV